MRNFKLDTVLLILTLLSAILAVCPLSAQEPAVAVTDSLKHYQLSEVEIRALENLNVLNSPVPLQTLSKKTLENLNSLSVADAVRYFSGVQLKDYGGIGGLKTINIRSLGTNHTQVFYDGIAIGNAQNGQVDLGKLSLSNMEEVTLHNGQDPDLFQPAKAYASANSISLVSTSPLFTKDKPLNTSFHLKGGSFGLLNPTLNVDYKINKNLSARISSEYINAHGRYDFNYTNGVYDTTATRHNADINALRLEASLYGRPDSSTSWQTKYYHYASERGLPGAIVANRFDYSQRLWDESNFLQFAADKSISEWYRVAIKAKFAVDYNRYLDPEYVTTEGFLDNKYQQKEAYFSVANVFHFRENWRANFSVDYIHNMLNANLYRFPYPRRHTLLAALATDIRLDRLYVQGSLLASYVNDEVEKYQSAEDKNELTPTMMFSWQPFRLSDFRLRAFYKSIFRMPTFNDLYYTFIGNTFLRPEYTNQYNIGFTFHKELDHPVFKYISIQADGYHNRVRDKIVAIPSANLFRWTMMNLGEVAINGIESNMKVLGNVSSKIRFSALMNYTYQKAVDRTPNVFNYDHQIPYIPVHSGSFTAMFNAANYGLNYSFIYTGERYSQKANIPANYVDPWYTHDLSVWYSLQYNKKVLTVRAEVNNVLDQHYDVILNFPMPGRHYRLSLTMNI